MLGKYHKRMITLNVGLKANMNTPKPPVAMRFVGVLLHKMRWLAFSKLDIFSTICS